MNKLIKSVLITSALGFLSINVFADTQWIGQGPWQGQYGGSKINMTAAGLTPEEACHNAIYVNIQGSIPGYKNKVYTGMKAESEKVIKCMYDVYPDDGGVIKNQWERIYFNPYYTPSIPAN